jgi:hypothetical protein
MKGQTVMDTREAILIYQYSERIKSELIIASQLLAKMTTFQGEEFTGAKELMTSYLEALVREIRIAQNVKKPLINFVGAEKKVLEAIGKMKLSEYSDINRCLSEALSLVTTSCQASLEALMDKGLV